MKRIEDQVAVPSIVELGEVRAVRICNNGAVPARQRTLEEAPNRRAFPRSRRADDLEMLRFIERRDGLPGKREDAPLPSPARAPRPGRVDYPRSALDHVANPPVRAP